MDWRHQRFTPRLTVAVLKGEVEQRRRLEVELLGRWKPNVNGSARFARHLCQRLGRNCTPNWFCREGSKRVRREIGWKSGKNTSSSNETIESCRNLARVASSNACISRLPAALEELAARVPADVKFHWPRSGRSTLSRCCSSPVSDSGRGGRNAGKTCRSHDHHVGTSNPCRTTGP